MGRKKKESPPLKPTVAYSDFAKLDFRVGRVVTAERLGNSERLIRLEVDFGSALGFRTILAGIAQWYQAFDLLDKKFIFVVNIEAKPMMGIESNGMMLAIDTDDKAVLLIIDAQIEVGTVVR